MEFRGDQLEGCVHIKQANCCCSLSWLGEHTFKFSMAEGLLLFRRLQHVAPYSPFGCARGCWCSEFSKAVAVSAEEKQ